MKDEDIGPKIYSLSFFLKIEVPIGSSKGKRFPFFSYEKSKCAFQTRSIMHTCMYFCSKEMVKFHNITPYMKMI